MSEGRFEGRAAFQACVLDTLAWSAREGARVLHAWDADFAEWPWSNEAGLSALAAWARNGRQLHLLARDYGELARRHPRFVRWRRDHGHCVTARALEPELHPEASAHSVLLAQAAAGFRSVRLFDRLHWRGVISEQPADYRRELDCFDALAQRSGESFGASTLGL